MSDKPLAIVPTYLREENDLVVLDTCLGTLRQTVGDACDVFVVDDGSPAQTDELMNLCEHHDVDLSLREENRGFSAAVNVGLRRALEEGRDAILVNSDIEFFTDTWLRLMQEQLGEDGKLAAIVGGLLLYPNGLVQSAGTYFSLLTRSFDHRYRFGPGNLPEALTAQTCPVTAALMFIRHSTLEQVGLFDEDFRMGFEDVDFTVRAWLAGLQVVYQPGIMAIHHESLTRGRKTEKISRWERESWATFCRKHAHVNFAAFVPFL